MARDAVIRSDVIDVVTLGVTVTLVTVVALDVEGPVRAGLALAFVTFVPGWAVVTNWTSAAAVSRIALAVLLSLAICTAVATTALWLHVWHPVGLLYVMSSASAAAIVSGIVRRAIHTA